jgi:type III restriction enzyme
MSGFTFEKDLEHQTYAVDAVSSMLFGSEKQQVTKHTTKIWANPELKISKAQYYANIKEAQEYYKVEHTKDVYYDVNSNIIDVSMETGTGKTYTYAKTIYELNKTYDIYKFIVVVPTLSIKAGTVNFLKSDALKEHFRDDYEREIKTHVVESKKNSNKKKKQTIDQGLFNFIDANKINKKYIHVLVINAGMLNSKSLEEEYDITGWVNNHRNTPINALKAVRPIMIIDEPHKFSTANKTWKNIEKIEPQYIIRYGATFNDDYKNLVYRLTAVDAFNQDLVKGVTAYVEDIVGGDKANLKLKKVDGKQALFELDKNNNKSNFSLTNGESLATIHHALHDLTIEHMNKTTVALSNGLELKSGNSINPYSYEETIQDNMMQKAIKKHFEIERKLLTQTPRIKPLTLFFIDDIKGYRDGNELSGNLKTKFEKWIIAIAKKYLKNEQNIFYRDYLEKTIKDVSKTHGGYFSRDNTAKDDKIEQEVIEILHDKEKLLSLDNTRRFIFSKWTLKEGWDNPNVFQICKLRSSGSTTSKLQEVGRGLRLPVNEHMARVKNKDFQLHYYVDFTEADFADSLVAEVNSSSFKDIPPDKLTEDLEKQILDKYSDETSVDLLLNLIDKKIIDKNKNFVNSNSYSELKVEYPQAFPMAVKANKIKKAGKDKKHTPMRVGRYQELRQLWELINKKAILEYKIKDESEFLTLFKECLNNSINSFKQTGVVTRRKRMSIEDNTAITRELHKENDTLEKISTISYEEFLKRLAKTAFIKISTLHRAFEDIKETFDINEYLNESTIRKIKYDFNCFLRNNAFYKFELDYHVISNEVHPSKFTDDHGYPKENVLSSDLGVNHDNTVKPLDSYLFEEVFYDSELEKRNITQEDIEMVTVFTKIPKNSIKIPVAGGFSYSPDFAYVVKTKNNEIVNFVIETKNVISKDNLRKEENSKIKHAQRLFNNISKDVKVNFKTQFSSDKIIELIKKHT